ncbi:MAG: hypothetical protein IPM91_21455 [Bacteroidetes bacterium]|nr:hypothetical protein [Bacteroidota bacterium]
MVYNYDPFNVGYATHDEEGKPLIGGRRLDTWENSFKGSYIFKNNMWLTLIARHYWITGDYKKYFSLDQEGEMIENSLFTGNSNFNFNVMNIDIIYEWRFAPGSILNIIYKNGLSNETQIIKHQFGDNFSRVINDPQSRTIAIKVLYFLDYLKVHGKMGRRYHKSEFDKATSFTRPSHRFEKSGQ